VDLDDAQRLGEAERSGATWFHRISSFFVECLYCCFCSNQSV